MDFEEIVKKTDFATAVCLRYEQLSQTSGFFENLDIAKWICILWDDSIPSELKERAQQAIQDKAVTYEDWRIINNHNRGCPELVEVAKQKMLEFASTLDEYFLAADGNYDFDILRKLARSASDWGKIARVAAKKAKFMEVDIAVIQLRNIPDPGYREWVRIYSNKDMDDFIKDLAIERIRNADIGFDDLIELSRIRLDNIADVIFEKLIDAMDSTDRCRTLYNSGFCLTNDRRWSKFLVKAMTLVKTFEDWFWLKTINNHKGLFTKQIVMGMIITATTLEQWYKTYISLQKDWPEHGLVFQKMKEMAV